MQPLEYINCDSNYLMTQLFTRESSYCFSAS